MVKFVILYFGFDEVDVLMICDSESDAYEMALSHQIDYEYALNPNLLIEHYMANSTTAECYRENVNVTHNHFLTD